MRKNIKIILVMVIMFILNTNSLNASGTSLVDVTFNGESIDICNNSESISSIKIVVDGELVDSISTPVATCESILITESYDELAIIGLDSDNSVLYSSFSGSYMDEEYEDFFIDIEKQFKLYNADEYVSIEELKVSIYIAAHEMGISYSEAIESYFLQFNSVISARSSASAYGIATKMPKSTTGYIFWVDNESSYNHVGIYVESNVVVEAKSPTEGITYCKIDAACGTQYAKKGRNIHILTPLYADGSPVNDRRLTDAAAWAENQALNDSKVYDPYPTDNKSWTIVENTKYNCSELVWKAFKYGGPYSKNSGSTYTGLDFDNNGGSGVYPDDIYKSKHTKINKTISAGTR